MGQERQKEEVALRPSLIHRISPARKHLKDISHNLIRVNEKTYKRTIIIFEAELAHRDSSCFLLRPNCKIVPLLI
jgi:hypothetical protein